MNSRSGLFVLERLPCYLLLGELKDGLRRVPTELLIERCNIGFLEKEGPSWRADKGRRIVLLDNEVPEHDYLIRLDCRYIRSDPVDPVPFGLAYITAQTIP